MEVNLRVFFLLIGAFAAIHFVQAQDQEGFISLDCGLVPKDDSYTEKTNNITYKSDWNFTSTGESKKIDSQYNTLFQQQLWALRSFPDGNRNCYNLNLTKGDKYFIRASFVYGNYDGLNMLPSFDLYIGPNKWTPVDIQGLANATILEIVHVLTSNNLQVCLVKTGSTVPFISSLELRPLKNDSYVTQSGSLMTYLRLYFTTKSGFIRFEEDPHDRIWISYFDNNEWTQKNTNLTVDISNYYEPPQLAMRNAATPKNSSEPLTISWKLTDKTAQSYIYMHFAEIQLLKSNETREFNITYNNGKNWYTGFRPYNLSVSTIYNPTAVTSPDGEYEFSFMMTKNSTLPPLISALEVYTVVEFLQLETDENDVDAITNIVAVYGSSKPSWQGDPCSPQEYLWEGLRCSYPDSDSPRITSLNLSSSGLEGTITSYIFNLTRLETLDLSKNNLTGEIPAFLANMKSLRLINLSENQLNGSIPSALHQRLLEDKSLIFDFNGTQVHCPSDLCKKPKDDNKIIVPVVASVASLAVVIVVLAIFFVFRRKKLRNLEASQISATSNADTRTNESPTPSALITKDRKFTYSEVLRMTNNFEQVLGKGGFGTVYHGYSDDTQIAVKMLSHSSAQGYKQFKAEVELLLRVHHRNLVSLVGYCDDGDHLALIYEYMANGDLKEHLSGKRGGNVLSWADRLRIAVEAAQGLEYLHNGCKPPMVHRDVKTTNILLNEHYQAKLADFGLSRSFPVEGESHVSTVVAGTPGYLDPEYYRTNWLSEKSDVYSFGIVLLEIITNRPVIDKTHKKTHITEWIGFMLTKGDIKIIVDPKLQADYATNTVWKAVELAIACVNPTSSRRPTMPHVVMELNECLGVETSRTQGSKDMYTKDSLDLSVSVASEFSGPRAR